MDEMMEIDEISSNSHSNPSLKESNGLPADKDSLEEDSVIKLKSDKAESISRTENSETTNTVESNIVKTKENSVSKDSNSKTSTLINSHEINDENSLENHTDSKSELSKNMNVKSGVKDKVKENKNIETVQENGVLSVSELANEENCSEKMKDCEADKEVQENTSNAMMFNLSKNCESKIKSAQGKEEESCAAKTVEYLSSKVSELETLNEGHKCRIKDLELMNEQEREMNAVKLNEKDKEIKRLSEKTQKQLADYMHLLGIKIALDMEIAAYRKRLEGEEARLNISHEESMSGETAGRGTPVRHTPLGTTQRKRAHFESEEKSLSDLQVSSSAKSDIEISDHDAEGKIIKIHNKENTIESIVKEAKISPDQLEALSDVKPIVYLPPEGEFKRKKIIPGMRVYIMEQSQVAEFGIGMVLTMREAQPDKLYKIKLENCETDALKLFNAKQLAYMNPWEVKIPVGTRICARYSDDVSSAVYAGIIAEPPKMRNNARYLIFFDNGSAQYIYHHDIFVMCAQSNDVSDDVHEYKDFIKSYLQKFPEVPMVKLRKNQITKTGFKGKWWDTKVLEIDASIVQMFFIASNRTEWIYRGSTRLKLLYDELNPRIAAVSGSSPAIGGASPNPTASPRSNSALAAAAAAIAPHDQEKEIDLGIPHKSGKGPKGIGSVTPPINSQPSATASSGTKNCVPSTPGIGSVTPPINSQPSATAFSGTKNCVPSTPGTPVPLPTKTAVPHPIAGDTSNSAIDKSPSA